MKQYHVTEELAFSMKQEEIESFLAGMNLRMIEYLDNEAIDKNI